MPKKTSDFNKLIKKIIEKTGLDLNDLNEEQIRILQNLAEGNQQVSDIMDAQWHFYPLPDYEKIAKPIAGWLQPLAQFENPSDLLDICQAAEKEAAKMERQQVADDLHHFIYAYLAFLHNDELDTFDNNVNIKSLCAAFWIISHFNLTELLDTVLETLRQPYMILDHIYLNGSDFIGTTILHDIGKNQMEKLMEFLQEQGYIPIAKHIVFDALALTYELDPPLRLKTLHLMNNYLQRCLQIGLEGGDVSNVSHYANTLAFIHAKETLPMLRKIYENLDIPYVEVGGIEEVEEIMDDSHASLASIMPLTIDESIDLISKYGDWEEEEDWEEEDEEEDWDEEENILFNPNVEMKQYQIQVKLKGTIHQTIRLLKVPSNIYLDALAQFVLLSLNWNEFDMAWFESPKVRFIDTMLTDARKGLKGKELMDMETKMLENLFTPPNSKVTFFVKDGFEPWIFDIKLTKTGTYQEDDKPFVKLLNAVGPAPTSSIDTMEEYENDLAEDKLDMPDIEEINKEFKNLEDSML